ALWLFPHRHRVHKSMVLAVASVVFFLCIMPYSLLDWPHFLQGLAAERAHYARGHPGYEGPPGLAQTWHYLGGLYSEWGAPATALAAFGLYRAARVNPRYTAVLAAAPLVLLAVMSTQRVNFMRNLLPMHLFFTMLCAYGTLAAWPLLRSLPRATAVSLAAGFIAAVLPWQNLPLRIQLMPEPRNAMAQDAQGWDADHQTILIADRLGIDTRPLWRFTTQTYPTLAHPKEVLARVEKAQKGYLLAPWVAQAGAQPAEIYLNVLKEKNWLSGPPRSYGYRPLSPKTATYCKYPRFLVLPFEVH
ncbi:MAG: hypothetical protein K2Q01_01370, partial [Rickettsiales bacterium]|nr:hypothetical protein [Rickettsiales bacterium]